MSAGKTSTPTQTLDDEGTINYYSGKTALHLPFGSWKDQD